MRVNVRDFPSKLPLLLTLVCLYSQTLRANWENGSFPKKSQWPRTNDILAQITSHWSLSCENFQYSSSLSFTVSPQHVQYYCQSSQTVCLLISFAFLACSSWFYCNHWRTSFPYLNRICISQASCTASSEHCFWRIYPDVPTKQVHKRPL